MYLPLGFKSLNNVKVALLANIFPEFTRSRHWVLSHPIFWKFTLILSSSLHLLLKVVYFLRVFRPHFVRIPHMFHGCYASRQSQYPCFHRFSNTVFESKDYIKILQYRQSIPKTIEIPLEFWRRNMRMDRRSVPYMFSFCAFKCKE